MEGIERTTIGEHIAYWQGQVDLLHEIGYPPIPEADEPQTQDASEVTLSARYLRAVRRTAVGLGAFSLANGVVSGISLATGRLLGSEAAVASIGCNGILIASVAMALKEQFQDQPQPSSVSS